MKLTHRHRGHRTKAPQIFFITDEEIAADLHYPATATRRPGGRTGGRASRRARR
jgi:hypothetical protein